MAMVVSKAARETEPISGTASVKSPRKEPANAKELNANNELIVIGEIHPNSDIVINFIFRFLNLDYC